MLKGASLYKVMNVTDVNAGPYSSPFLVNTGTKFIQTTTNEPGFEWPFSTAALGRSPQGRTSTDAADLLFVVLVATMVEPHVDLREYFQQACTGTLLRDDLVLTLASCVQAAITDYEPDPSQTVIYRREGIPLRALKIFIFRNQKALDYAVIVTETSEQNEFPSLPEGESSFSDVRNSCFLAGYGNQQRLLLANFHIRWLQDVRVQEISCRKPNDLCLNFRDLIPCRGDVGSPIVCGGVLFALYSPGRTSVGFYGTECSQRYKTVFQRVAPVADWVRQIVEAPSTTLQWLTNPWWLVLLCISVLLVMGGIYYCLIESLQMFRLNVRDETQAAEEALASASSYAAEREESGARS